MAINLNLSENDLNAARNMDSPPAGFETENMSGDSIFDGLGDLFGDSNGSSNDFGQSSGDSGQSMFDVFGGGGQQGIGGAGGQGDIFANPAMQGAGGLGTGGFNTGVLGNPALNNPMVQQNNTAPAKPDAFDTVIDASMAASKSLLQMFKELIESVKTRNVDDYGWLGTNLIKTGLGVSGVGVVLSICGAVGSISLLKFGGFSGQLILAGMMSLSAGLISLGTSAMVLDKVGRREESDLDELPDLSESSANAYEENIGSETDDLFEDAFADLFGDSDGEDDSGLSDGLNLDLEDELSLGDEVATSMDNYNPDEALSGIRENQVLSRQNLFNTFVPMLPINTPGFAEKKVIEKDSEDFYGIQAACLKALANILRKDVKDIPNKVTSATETIFSYEIRLERSNGVRNLKDLANEIQIYFRRSYNDMDTLADVYIDGDNFLIIITRGTKPIVTFGDAFKLDYCRDYYLNTKHALPVMLGVDELGEVLLGDAKCYDSVMMAGKSRSGKSWYILSFLMSLMLFNAPEDISFVIIDPKETNLFKTIALMPHCIGLHSDSDGQALRVMDDLIEVEAPRRKKMLAEHKVDTIWELRDLGVKLPVLYLVMDEYITIKENLKPEDKQLDSRLLVIMTQFPSIGIRVLFVPHRATGVVSKTNRSNIQFASIARGTLEDASDTLDVKWTRQLTAPGDIGLKTSEMPEAKYVRGLAITPLDITNTKFIRTVAKAFYKMGVDLPDMSCMTVACNRDNDYIAKELKEDGTRVQFSADSINSQVDSPDDLDWGDFNLK